MNRVFKIIFHIKEFNSCLIFVLTTYIKLLLFIRLNNDNIMLHADDTEKEKSCFLRESTPPKLFSPMDIDNDMIKLFPTLDFSLEHNINE